MKSHKRRLPGKGGALLLLGLVLISGALISGTLAYLKADTDPLVNTFTPAQVSGTLYETVEGSTKTSITVKNTGSIPAYIRVMLAPYWQNAEGQRVGSQNGWTVNASLNDRWFQGNDGYFYYRYPVAAGEETANLLDEALTLKVEGGYAQALDVFAECIQAEPKDAVEQAWDVLVVQDGGTSVLQKRQ